MHRLEKQGGLFERVRRWSVPHRSLTTMFKRSASDKNNEPDTWASDRAFFTYITSTTSEVSATTPDEVKHVTGISRKVARIEADVSFDAAGFKREHSEPSDAPQPPSDMLLAFAAVQSWGRSSQQRGTEHYGAGYHKV